MRPLLLCVFIGSTLLLDAQSPIEIADRRDQIVRYHQVIPAPDSSWIFAGVHQGWTERQALFVARASDGALLWEEPGAGLYEPIFMAPIAGHFIAAGPTNACSLPVPADRVERRNSTGGIEWSELVDISIKGMDVSGEMVVLVGTPGVEEGYELIILNGAGAEFAQWELPSEPITVRWSPDGTIITISEDVVSRWNDSGDLLMTASLGANPLDAAVIDANDIRILYSEHLVKHGADLAAIDTIPITADTKWMEVSDGSIWITGNENFTQVDPVSSLSSSFTIDPIDSLDITGSAVSNGIIMTSGTAHIDGRSSGIMRSFTTTGSQFDHDMDVAVTVASVDTLYLTSSAPAFPNMVRLHVQVTLAVENKSSVPLQSVLLNTQRTVGHCGADFGASVLAEDLALAPGATALVQMPLITYWPMDIQLGENLSFERCYVALAPDHLVDRSPADNSTCYTFNAIHTAIEELVDRSPIMIWPQPFTDRFSMRLAEPSDRTTQLIFRDATGREIKRSTMQAGQEMMEVDAQDLPQGVSILEIHSGSDRSVHRLVRVL
jgi:hypothetical protein